MNFVIDEDVYEWLSNLQLLKVTQVIQQLPNGKLALDETATNNLLNGTIFSKILQKVIENNSKPTDRSTISQTNIDGLKTATNASSKLYNWNVICDTLKRLNIDIDQDVKSLILAGDTDMINDILRELYFKVKKIGVIFTRLCIVLYVTKILRIPEGYLKTSLILQSITQRVPFRLQL